jgi:hypothetical protein
VTYQLLADTAEGAFFSRLTSCSQSIIRAGTEVGPLLRSAAASNTVPITGSPVQDELVWDLQADGSLYTGAGSDCSIRFAIGLDTRIIHGAGVVAAKKGTRIQLTELQLLTGTSIGGAGGRPPGFAEGQINDSLRSDFPKNLTSQVLSFLTIPTPTGAALNLWKNGKTVTDYNDLNTCKQDSDCPTIIGPEDGCFHPSDTESLMPLLVDGSVDSDLRKNKLGACVWRLEPKRVNIHPQGVDVILISDPSDPQYQTVQTLASLKPGGPLFCTAPPTMPLNPLGPDAVAPLAPSRSLKFTSGQ